MGILLAIPAIILGVIGIIHANKQPAAEGMGHAITAVVLGVLGPLVGTGLVVLLMR